MNNITINMIQHELNKYTMEDVIKKYKKKFTPVVMLNQIFEFKDIVFYLNTFQCNDTQKLFIAYYIKKQLCKNSCEQTINFLQSIKSLIPYESYLILIMELYHYYIDVSPIYPYLKDVTNHFRKQDVIWIAYGIKYRMIPVKLWLNIINRLITFYFNVCEVSIMNECFPQRDALETYLNLDNLSFYTSDDEIRSDFLHILIKNNKQYLYNQPRRFYLLREYFTPILMDNKFFIKNLCKHRLLTKDIINHTFETKLFEIIILYHKQFDDYVKSLIMLQSLS